MRHDELDAMAAPCFLLAGIATMTTKPKEV
jgi:hypothetical protein